MANCYATLTQFKSNLGITGTTEDADIIRVLEAVSRYIETRPEKGDLGGCNRKFYCMEEVRVFDGGLSPLYLNDILSISGLKGDYNEDGTYEVTFSSTTDYTLLPLQGYPKEAIRLKSGSLYTSFGRGVLDGIQITGVWGHGDGITATPYLNSTAVVNTGGISSGEFTHALASGKGALFSVGQTIRVDSEQLYITGISTDTLTFQRALNGTSAAAHLAAAVIYIYQYPSPIVTATLIQASRLWKRKDSAYPDMVSNPMTGQVQGYKGLDPDFVSVMRAYRKAVFI